MKLLRIGDPGRERPALLDQNGALRDLSAHITDIDSAWLDSGGIARLRGIDPATLPRIEGAPRVGCPVGDIGKYICVGLNYSDHAAESNLPIPKEPILFMKSTTAIQGPNDDLVIPRGSTKTDWEVELAIIIGRRASYVSAEEAIHYVAGLCVSNDVSEVLHDEREAAGQGRRHQGAVEVAGVVRHDDARARRQVGETAHADGHGGEQHGDADAQAPGRAAQCQRRQQDHEGEEGHGDQPDHERRIHSVGQLEKSPHRHPAL
jgi:hypothetical protein